MKAWRAWARFLDGREPGLTLAVFRILMGLALLGNLGSVVIRDIVELIWVQVGDGGYRDLGSGGWMVSALGGPTRGVVWFLVVLTMAAGVTLTVGLGGRVSALVAAQGLLALTMLNGHTKGSYDALQGNALWLLVLADSTATLSVDCRRRTGRWTSEDPVPWWPRGLLVLQLSLTYFGTGLHKVSAAWTPGGGFSALYYILQQPSWHRWDMTWLGHVYSATQVLTAAVWLFEITWPLVPLWMLARTIGPDRWWARALLRVDLRKAYLAFGMAMHLGIAVLMEVGPFSAIAIALYPCMFRPGELRAGTARVLRRVRQPR